MGTASIVQIATGDAILSITSRLKQQFFLLKLNDEHRNIACLGGGKIAASENPIIKTAAITAFKAQYGIDMSIAQTGQCPEF